MFKKKINWQLSLVVAIVSICSLVLIQQYVIAQSGWVDPDSLPGSTPSNVFVVNPLADDLQLNNHKILGTDLIIDGSNVPASTAITVTNGRKICIGGTTDPFCKSAWPTVTNGITGAGTADYIPIFTGTGTSIGNSDIRKTGNYSEYSIAGDGGMIISNNRNFPALTLSLTDFFISNGIKITNRGNGNSVYIDDGDNSSNGYSQTKSSIYITNDSVGNGLYIKQTNVTTTSDGRPLRVDDSSGDTTPFVIDWDGRVGIGTLNPNKNLHVQTASGNAEIDIQSGTAVGNHWGIYHDVTSDDLFFWKDAGNKIIFTDNGNINLLGSVCDINGNNCLSSASNYWTQDASLNLSRTNSNVYLVANGQALPAAATGSSSRFVWYPNKSAIRAGAVNTTYWDDASIGTYSTAFGYNSQASASKATVSGGESNRISDAAAGLSSTIGGGYNNQIIKSVQGTIAGGGSNSIGTGIASKNAAFIGGGVNNLNNGSSGVIGGGSGNSINDGENSVIGGGYKNVIAGFWSAIVGGSTNSIGYPPVGYGYSFIGGGESNTTTAAYVTIGGGYNNSSAGKYASILGGASNKADGDYSFAGGRNMQLSSAADNSFVWGVSDTALPITRENAFIVFPNRPTLGSAPRFGFGTASPLTYFHVNSNDSIWVEPFIVSRAGADTFFYLGIERWSANMGIDIGAYSNADGQYKNLTINRGGQGNVGIGVTEPTRRLQVEGDVAVRSANDANNYYVQLDQISAAPLATDCNEATEYGRMMFETEATLDAGTLWVCNITGWSKAVLSTP